MGRTEIYAFAKKDPNRIFTAEEVAAELNISKRSAESTISAMVRAQDLYRLTTDGKSLGRYKFRGRLYETVGKEIETLRNSDHQARPSDHISLQLIIAELREIKETLAGLLKR